MVNWYRKVILPCLLNSEMGSVELEKIRRKMLADVSGVVLEIGVGPGYNLQLYKNVLKLYALEPSQELIAIAEKRAGSLPFPIEFLNTGAEDIPLPSQSVDIVVSTWTLCSVADPKKVLQEIRRVLRPAGRFIFVDHGASPNSGFRLMQTALTSITKYFTGNCHYDRPINQLIKESGFVIQKIEYPKERFKPLLYNYEGIAAISSDPQTSN